MEYTAPAKVNLYLDVLKKRDDGYHEIETLFEKISLCDRLTVEKSPAGTKITCSNPAVPLDKTSLLARTMEYFRRESGDRTNFEIFLEKNIPVSGGLGGGSSDAACLLKALNEISGFPLKTEELVKIGRSLGADVPLFLYDTPFTVGKGRGDIIREVKTDLILWHVLITPPFGVSTAEIYREVDPSTRPRQARPCSGLTKTSGADTIFIAFLLAGDAGSIAKNLHNDLQKIVLEKFPVFGKIFSEIRKTGAEGILLSGSGGTVFGIFDGEEKAKEAAERLAGIFSAKDDWRVIAASTYKDGRLIV